MRLNKIAIPTEIVPEAALSEPITGSYGFTGFALAVDPDNEQFVPGSLTF